MLLFVNLRHVCVQGKAQEALQAFAGEAGWPGVLGHAVHVHIAVLRCAACAGVRFWLPCTADVAHVLTSRLRSCNAEDVYYCSLEHGPKDAHTSLGYYNISKVLQSTGDLTGVFD